MSSFQRVQASIELGPEDVSLLERCPHFRGCYVQSYGDSELEEGRGVLIFHMYYSHNITMVKPPPAYQPLRYYMSGIVVVRVPKKNLSVGTSCLVVFQNFAFQSFLGGRTLSDLIVGPIV